MRDLTETLKAGQKADSLDPLVKIVLTHGEDSYTYDSDRILDHRFTGEGDRQNAQVLLDNWDGALTPIDLKGFVGVISRGVTTDGGDEYSPLPKMKVIAQQLLSSRGDEEGRQLTCNLGLAGIPNQLAEDRANEKYIPDEDDNKTVKTLIREIFGDSGVTLLAVFNHCDSYDVVFDSEDSLIDTFKPKDSFSIYEGDSRMAKINQLLHFTKCVMRVRSDGLPHIFQPKTDTSTAWQATTAYSLRDQVIPTDPNGYQYICTTAGNSGATEPTWPTTIGATVSDGTVVWTVRYDYEYSLAPGDHPFFAKTYRKRLVIPNYIVVRSLKSQETPYSGYAEDEPSSALMKKVKYYRFRVESNAQCTAIAAAILSRYQLDAERGHGFVPLNVGAEVHDYVKITDSRAEDWRTGNIRYLSEHINLQDKIWEMEFRFGAVDMAGLMGTTPPSLSGPGGTMDLDLSEIIAAIKQLQAWLEALNQAVLALDAYNKWWEQYIFIDDVGDIVLRAESGAWVQIFNDLSLTCNKNFGMMLSSVACRLFWYTKGGTLDHVFCPSADGHGKLGDSSYQWLEGRIKKIYCDTELQLPTL